MVIFQIKKIITGKYELEKVISLAGSKSKKLEDLIIKTTKEKMDFIEKLGSVNKKFESIYSEHTKLLNKSKRDQVLSANEIDLLHKRCKELEETIIDLEKNQEIL